MAMGLPHFNVCLASSSLTSCTASGVVVASKPKVLSEVEDFYSRLYASHTSRPDPENEDAQATLTRHLTEDLPEVSVTSFNITHSCNFGNIWASRRSIWKISATPSGKNLMYSSETPTFYQID
jgi:hypothetical protein